MDAGAADKARAFAQFCQTGGCAPGGISQTEFIARTGSRRGAGLKFSGREIEHFAKKFLGHKKFTLETNLQVTRPAPGTLSISGLFISWFDDDIASLRQESYDKSCQIASRAPLVCKIEDGRTVIWFDPDMALHLVELAYDAGDKTYKTRRHRTFKRIAD